MVKKPTQKAINQFQALAAKNQAPAMSKPMSNPKKRAQVSPKQSNMMMPSMAPKAKGGRMGGMM